MRVGRERAALPGLEIHHVVADRAAAKRQRRVARLLEQREVDAEALVGGLGAGDRLEDEIDRRALADQIERRGDVRQHAGLRRNVELDPDLVEHRQQRVRILGAVGRRIDADHGVAGAEQQAVENARRDAARIVGRMVGLQPHREAAGQGRSCCGTRVTTVHFAAMTMRSCSRLILLTAAAISGVTPGASAARTAVVASSAKQPVAKSADGQMRDRRKGRAVVRVDDQARHLVGLVGNDVSAAGMSVSGRSASANCAATRSSPLSAATPAS